MLGLRLGLRLHGRRPGAASAAETTWPCRQPQLAVERHTVYVACGTPTSMIVARSENNGEFVRAAGDDPDRGSACRSATIAARASSRWATRVVVTAIVGEVGGGKDGDLLAWRSTDRGATWSAAGQGQRRGRRGARGPARDGSWRHHHRGGVARSPGARARRWSSPVSARRRASLGGPTSSPIARRPAPSASAAIRRSSSDAVRSDHRDVPQRSRGRARHVRGLVRPMAGTTWDDGEEAGKRDLAAEGLPDGRRRARARRQAAICGHDLAARADGVSDDARRCGSRLGRGRQSRSGAGGRRPDRRVERRRGPDGAGHRRQAAARRSRWPVRRDRGDRLRRYGRRLRTRRRRRCQATVLRAHRQRVMR